jgi:magnesium-transporting ATPase (P-type)
VSDIAYDQLPVNTILEATDTFVTESAYDGSGVQVKKGDKWTVLGEAGLLTSENGRQMIAVTTRVLNTLFQPYSVEVGFKTYYGAHATALESVAKQLDERTVYNAEWAELIKLTIFTARKAALALRDAAEQLELAAKVYDELKGSSGAR